jgi:hypothetical protein
MLLLSSAVHFKLFETQASLLANFLCHPGYYRVPTAL